jgi:hypothetical protein
LNDNDSVNNTDSFLRGASAHREKF